MTDELTALDPLDEFPLSAEAVGPGEVVDAGPDPRPRYHVREGRRRRVRYRQLFGRALRAVDPLAAEELVREALSLAASASYWLEGTDDFANVHREIHEMGRFAREHHPRGCRLTHGERGYEQRCPVAISHKRFGFSPGMVVRRFTCSLCGDDVADCSHCHNRLYRVRGGPADSPTGRCRVCSRDECDHSPERTYLATMSSVAGEIVEMTEVSLVARPVQPDARLTAIPVSTPNLRATLGAGFVIGTRVDCNRCLEPCPGFDYLPEE